ncbi:hypothetical protein JCM6882_003898 [Rhodosporidiobolus microsporus]
MSNMDSGFVEGKNNIFCWLGNHNGAFPNGTAGAGEWTEFGYYSPSMDELMGCQEGNDPWTPSVRYAEWTAYIVLAYFAVAAAWNHFNAWNNLNRSLGLRSVVPVPSKLKALIRSVDMARPDSRFPAVGTLLISSGLLLFGLVICFAIFPYYRPPNYGSSPLGLRSEWVSTALIVFIFATAVKRNVLGFLTGLPYPRLLDLHKIISWISFSAAIVHAVAMIVRAKRQAPWWYALQNEPLAYGWAAWGALMTMFCLCALSLSPLRRLSHEFFYLFHMLNVLLFIVFMYYHCDRLLASWAWLHAAVVVLATATLYRVLATAWRTAGFFRPQRASVEHLPDDALKIVVDVGGMEWQAGDHVFLRFGSIKLFPWQSHPFTVANLPQTSSSSSSAPVHASAAGTDDLEKRVSPSGAGGAASSTDVLSTLSSSAASNTMHLLLRPHTGLTARLSALAPVTSLPVYIDGPYSSHGSSSSAVVALAAADAALLVAGGTGASWVFPLLLDVLRKEGGGRLGRGGVRLVWAVRREECVGWYAERVRELEALAEALGVEVKIEVYVSRSCEGGAGPEKEKEEKKKEEEEDEIESLPARATGVPSFVKFIHRRVDGASAVDEALLRAGEKGCKRVAVFSCGPRTLAQSVRNAAARAQVGILKRGSVAGSTVEEVELVEEVFDC